MVQQHNNNIDYFRGPGSPTGRARISTGKVCPGAPKKAPSPPRRDSDDLLSHMHPDWQMNYIVANNEAARSPRRLLFGPHNDVADGNNERPNAVRLFGEDDNDAVRLFGEDGDDAVEERNVGQQRQRPVARAGVAVISPVREDASS